MGTDISGWFEFSDPKWDAYLDEVMWVPIICATGILSRDYTLFGSLFGVRNGTSFAPIAAARGLPGDASDLITQESSQKGSFGHSWISLAELNAVDWTEKGFDAPAQTKPSNGAEWLAAQVMKRSKVQSDYEKELEKKGYIVRVPPLTRRDTLGPNMELLLKMAQPLGDHYGSERVRLVVWFDN